MGITGRRWKCWQVCVPSGGSREEPVPYLPQPLEVPVFHGSEPLPSPELHLPTSGPPIPPLSRTLCLPLSLMKTLMITVDSPPPPR